MNRFDGRRRGALKGIGTAALMAASVGMLDAAVPTSAEKRGRMLVLTGDSPYAASFLDGVRRARGGDLLRHEAVRPIEAFVALEALLDAEIAQGGLQEVTGLLNAGEYPLLIEALQRRHFRLKAEISHCADAGGTRHNVTVPHTASVVAVRAGKLLPLHPEWAFFSGVLFGTGCTQHLLSEAGSNRFRTAAVKRPERGDAAVVSFLATLKKEQTHV